MRNEGSRFVCSRLVTVPKPVATRDAKRDLWNIHGAAGGRHGDRRLRARGHRARGRLDGAAGDHRPRHDVAAGFPARLERGGRFRDGVPDGAAAATSGSRAGGWDWPSGRPFGHCARARRSWRAWPATRSPSATTCWPDARRARRHHHRGKLGHRAGDGGALRAGRRERGAGGAIRRSGSSGWRNGSRSASGWRRWPFAATCAGARRWRRWWRRRWRASAASTCS